MSFSLSPREMALTAPLPSDASLEMSCRAFLELVLDVRDVGDTLLRGEQLVEVPEVQPVAGQHPFLVIREGLGLHVVVDLGEDVILVDPLVCDLLCEALVNHRTRPNPALVPGCV